MLRMFLWILFLYVVWKIIDQLTSGRPKKTPPHRDEEPRKDRFRNVQEADFEDITTKRDP